jgi:hypothetical protein
MKHSPLAPTHTLPNGLTIRVYDNGGKTLDQLTVVVDDGEARPGFSTMLGLSPGGIGFSQFTEGQEGRHLGKPVAFSDLDDETRKHIEGRLV